MHHDMMTLFIDDKLLRIIMGFKPDGSSEDIQALLGVTVMIPGYFIGYQCYVLISYMMSILLPLLCTFTLSYVYKVP